MKTLQGFLTMCRKAVVAARGANFRRLPTVRDEPPTAQPRQQGIEAPVRSPQVREAMEPVQKFKAIGLITLQAGKHRVVEYALAQLGQHLAPRTYHALHVIALAPRRQ